MNYSDMEQLERARQSLLQPEYLEGARPDAAVEHPSAEVEKERRILAEIRALHQAEAEQLRRIEEIEASRGKQALQLNFAAERSHQPLADPEFLTGDVSEDTSNQRDEEFQLLIAKQRLRAEAEERVKAEAENHSAEAESEAPARAAEPKTVVPDAGQLAHEEERYLAEREARRRQDEEDSRARAEKERRIRAEIQELKQAEEEQRRQLDAKVRVRVETDARSRQELVQGEATEQTCSTSSAASGCPTEIAAEQRSESEPKRVEDFSQSEEVAEGCKTEGESLMEVESKAPEATQAAEDPPEIGTGDQQSDVHVDVAAQKSVWVDVDLNKLDPRAGTANPPTEKLHEEPIAPVAPALETEIELHATELDREDSEFLGNAALQLNNKGPAERAAALHELADRAGAESFDLITAAFDDPSPDVRNAAAHALHDLETDKAASFTRALRAASPERRRKIGKAIAESGLAKVAVNNLTGEGRDRTYAAFALLFLMAKAGEVQPLMRVIEQHQSTEVRLAVVKLLTLCGQPEIVPAFRRLVVRGSLPPAVRSAVMEAIYQIGNHPGKITPSAA